MNQLRIYAPFHGPTGYEIFARDLIEELDKRGTHVCLEEFHGWGPFSVQLREEQHQVLGRALANKPYPQKGPLTNLNICLPEQVQRYDHMRNVNFTMFESDNIPKSWEGFIDNTDEMIVPTEFNRWSFTHNNDIHSEKFSVLPLGYNPERYNEDVEPLPLVFEGETLKRFPIRFLVVCEITDRKNFWGTLHTFYSVAAQIGVDKCCLLLKVGNYSKRLDLEIDIPAFRNKLVAENAIPDLKYNVFNYVPILPEEVHPNFLKIGTHYLSCSLGEGWDLTAMQAAACGLHVFVPMHSAYQCWLNVDCVTFLPIAKKMKALQTWPTGRLYENSYWYAYHMPSSIDIIVSNLLDPSILQLKLKSMKQFITHYQWSNLIDSYLKTLHLI